MVCRRGNIAFILGTRASGSRLPAADWPGRLTTARYYTPSGRSIQGLGISPDVQVQASRTEQQHFGPEREADLNHVLTNEGGTPQDQAAPPRNDMPPVAKEIPNKPPENWPTFDASKPDTDFQLQEALVLAKAMANQKRAALR